MHAVLIALSLVFLLADSALAATFHVTTTGNDSYSCSQAQAFYTPKRSIRAGVNCATSPGDIVQVWGGTYTERLTSATSGTSGNLITLTCRSGDTCRWRSDSANDDTTTDGQVLLVGTEFFRIEGFTFECVAASCPATVIRRYNPKASTWAELGADPQLGFQVVNNTFTKVGNNNSDKMGPGSHIIYLQHLGAQTEPAEADKFLVEGNTFSAVYCHGCIYTQATRYGIIRNNTITDFRQSALGGSSTLWHAWAIRSGTDFGSDSTPGGFHIIERNSISDCVKQSYVGSDIPSCKAIRTDVNQDNNIIRYNRGWAIGDANTRGQFIQVEARCDGDQIYRNIGWDIRNENCILVGSQGTDAPVGTQIYNNTCFNVACGIGLNHAKNATVKNNIIMGAAGAEIWVSDDTVAKGGNTFNNNLYFDPDSSTIGEWNTTATWCPSVKNNLTFAQWKTQSGGDANGLSVDPQFVSTVSGAEDLHLTAGSRAIGAGEGGTDMGAYEYDGTPGGPPVPPSPPTGLRVLQ